MTPEQLREWADAIEGEKPWAPRAADVCDQLRAHAAALEEIERLKAERDRAFEKLAIDAVQYDALLAERDRERKEHTQWVRDHQADTDAAHRAKQRAESALAEAERRGREQGMREAAGLCQSFQPKDFTAAGIMTRAKCADAILAAIEGKK